MKIPLNHTSRFEAKTFAGMRLRKSAPSRSDFTGYCFFGLPSGDAAFLGAKVRLAGGGGFFSQASLK